MKIDVVKDYDWTSAPRGSSFRQKAPRVWVRSYKLISNQIITTLKNYLAIIENAGGSGTAKDFYNKMYGNATEVEDDFNFPFFGDNLRTFSNTFGDTFQSGIGESGGAFSELFEGARTFIGGVANAMGIVGKDAIKQATDAASQGNFKQALGALVNGAKKGGDPGTYVESPMFYQFEKNDAPLEVSFVLSNTINSDSVHKNHALVRKLTYINRPLRRNSVAVDPPRIYGVRVPGHRTIRWAFCSDFSVSLLGTKRIINDVLTPEAYLITMHFQSLTLEHAGFVEGGKSLS